MSDNNPYATNVDDTSVSSCPRPSIGRSLKTRFIEKPGAIHLEKIREFGLRVENVCAGIQLNPELQKHLNRYLINTAQTSGHSEADKPLVRGMIINSEQSRPAPIASSVGQSALIRPKIVNVSNTSVVKNTTVNKTEINKHFTTIVTKVEKYSDLIPPEYKAINPLKTESKKTDNDTSKVSVRVGDGKPERIISVQQPVVTKTKITGMNNSTAEKQTTSTITSSNVGGVRAEVGLKRDSGGVHIDGDLLATEDTQKKSNPERKALDRTVAREDKPERILSTQQPVVKKMPVSGKTSVTEKKSTASTVIESNVGRVHVDVNLKRDSGSSHSTVDGIAADKIKKRSKSEIKSSRPIVAREDNPKRVISAQQPVVKKASEAVKNPSIEKKPTASTVTESHIGGLRRDLGLKHDPSGLHIDDGQPAVSNARDASKSDMNAKSERKSPPAIVSERLESHVSSETPNLELKRSPKFSGMSGSRSITGNIQAKSTVRPSTIDTELLKKVTRTINDGKILTAEKLNSAKYHVSTQAMTNANQPKDSSPFEKAVISEVALQSSTSELLGEPNFYHRRYPADISSHKSGIQSASEVVTSHAVKTQSPDFVSRSIIQRHKTAKVIADINNPVVNLPSDENKKKETILSSLKGRPDQFVGIRPVMTSVENSFENKNKMIYVRSDSNKPKVNFINDSGIISATTNKNNRVDQSSPIKRSLNTSPSDAIAASTNNDAVATDQNQMGVAGPKHEQSNSLNPEMTEDMVERLFTKFIRTMAVEGERQEFMR